MKPIITKGDAFVGRILCGAIQKKTLVNHGVRYSGEIEEADKERFKVFIHSDGAKRLLGRLEGRDLS